MPDAKLMDLFDQIQALDEPFDWALIAVASDRAEEVGCPALARALRWMSDLRKFPRAGWYRLRWHAGSNRLYYSDPVAQIPQDLFDLLPGENSSDYTSVFAAVAALAIALELHGSHE